MRLINEQLRELELGESNLSKIFWAAETDAAFTAMLERVKTQYRRLLNHLDEAQMREVRKFVSSTLIVGAIDGLQYGHALHRRRVRAKEKDAAVELILKHKRVKALLQKKKPVTSTKDICEALDAVGVPFPHDALVVRHKEKDKEKSRFWKDYSAQQPVKDAITGARTKIKQIDNDIR